MNGLILFNIAMFVLSAIFSYESYHEGFKKLSIGFFLCTLCELHLIYLSWLQISQQ